MDAVLKKHFWVLDLIFIALSAWLFSGAITAVLGNKLRSLPTLSKTRPAPLRNNTQRSSQKNMGIIVERNFFDSAKAPNPEEIQTEIDDTTAQELMAGDAGVETSLRASLVGTIVAEKDTRWSMAMITDRTVSETNGYRVGDKLMEEADVVAILTKRVILNHNGAREYLELQEEAKPRISRRYNNRKKAVAKNNPGSGIRRIADGRYDIERSEIDKTLSNLNKIAMQARIVPSFKNGESNGFKLFAIRPGSLYNKIGIQNGDIIHKINGFSMNSPDRALEVYQKLKTARSIDVEMTRRGKTKKMHYNIK
jgi:general secretion pathway protein C